MDKQAWSGREVTLVSSGPQSLLIVELEPEHNITGLITKETWIINNAFFNTRCLGAVFSIEV